MPLSANAAHCHGYANCCACDACRRRTVEKLASTVRRPGRRFNDGRDRRKIHALLDLGFAYVGDDDEGRPLLEAPLDVLLRVADV